MRTTLKKRSGRSANGNGANGPYPPELLPSPDPSLRTAPPSPPTAAVPPMPPTDGSRPERAFYRVRRNPLKLLAMGVVWLVVALLVGAGALAGGVKMYFDYSVAAIRPSSEQVRDAAEVLDLPVAGQPAVAIVIGYDRRPGETSAGRGDTIMLLRADPDKKLLTMLSFPRDLVVEHAGCQGHPPWTGRINEAYAYCGPRGTLTTVKKLTGIPINYMISVNFRAFINIVDELDGVYMDVDRRYFNDNSSGESYERIDLKPGYQHLNGKDALDFVRYRHTDSDLYRVVRQQEFVKAVKQRISSAWDILQLPRIVKALTDNIEVGKGGGKEITGGEVLEYANLAYTLPAGNFQQVPLEGVSGYFELEVAQDSLDDAVRRFMNPDANASEKAIAIATGKKLKDKSPAPPPSDVSIEVLNGSGVDGAADEAAVLLGRVGYNTENGGNADNFEYFRTTVLYESEVAGSKAAAQAVADLFGEATVEEAPASKPLTTMVQVVVGTTFQGTLGPAPAADDTPERQRPEVVTDPTSITPALRHLRKKVDFPIMVPTVREDGSSIDDNEGIRAYKIDDHKSLRLTYHTGSNEYWGIQQTSWEDPPILGDPTLERTIRGRNYKLFFSGAKLHIVAFRQDGGTYWIVNTLRNRLSTETMLAIAAGMKPLRQA
jgi:polyisoprenyl-teichoic acid--peptidoglycan teichoic acid transferase